MKNNNTTQVKKYNLNINSTDELGNETSDEWVEDVTLEEAVSERRKILSEHGFTPDQMPADTELDWNAGHEVDGEVELCEASIMPVEA